MRKKSKEDEQTLTDLSSAHRLSQVKCQLVQTSYIKRIKFFLFAIYRRNLDIRAKGLAKYVRHNEVSLYSGTSI